MQRCLVLAVMAMALAGCSEWQLRDSGSFVQILDGGSDVSRWLDELHETRAMSPELLQQTLQDREQAFRADPTASNRMRLALLFVTGNAAVVDRPRARTLLDGFDAGAGGVSEQELTTLLQVYLDAQAERSRQYSSLRKQLAAQQRRIEELEQQLQALTTIEQHIQQRDRGTGD
jgi:hypothetical protein